MVFRKTFESQKEFRRWLVLDAGLAMGGLGVNFRLAMTHLRSHQNT